MTRLLAAWERHYSRITRRRNARNHQPTRFAQCMTTRKAPK